MSFVDVNGVYVDWLQMESLPKHKFKKTSLAGLDTCKDQQFERTCFVMEE